MAAATISVNWGLYIWAVNNERVVEASLGDSINPLVTIAMGYLPLGERLRPAQWAAVATGVAAVLVLAIGYGKPPWVSLVLAFSFATYGLVKKKVNMAAWSPWPPRPPCSSWPRSGFLLWLAATGESTFMAGGAGHGSLLAATGIVTALPLICFGAAAIRVPLTRLGFSSIWPRSSSSASASSTSTRRCRPSGGPGSPSSGSPCHC
ncbi:Protein RarD [Streptomyces californicus]